MEKEYNYGLAFLRIIMSFEVVVFHFGRTAYEDFFGGPLFVFSRLSGLAVPVFMIMAAFLTYDIFSSKDNCRFVTRTERIIIPYLLWPIIAYVVLNGFSLVTKSMNSYSLKELGLNIICGCTDPLYVVWFQIDLLLCTVVVFLLFKIVNESAQTLVLVLIIIMSLWIQYSGTNILVFSKCFPTNSTTYARFVEMLPCFSVGILLSKYKVKEKLVPYWKQTVFVCAFIVAFLWKSNMFAELSGYNYQGIYPMIAGSIIFIAFLVLPIRDFKGESIVKRVSSLTMGVYFIHTIVEKILFGYINIFEKIEGTMVACLFIFGISLLVSWLISCVPNRWIKSLVQ